MITKMATWIGQLLGSGRYRVTAKLGEGGMGLVYKAWDDNLKCDVVVKVPRPEMVEDPEFSGRFTIEIRSLVLLAHPRIVRVLDVGHHEGLPFAVMQFLEGGNLRDRGNPAVLPVRERLNQGLLWLEGIASALDFIHGQNYVHRDVKPENIFFDKHGNPFLGDFGVAKVLADTRPKKQQTSHTGAGLILGTPHYMAPELILGEAYDGRVDQYALAVCVYEMISGRFPFEGAAGPAIFVQHTNNMPPRLDEIIPGIATALADGINVALAKDPARRFGTCSAFARVIVDAIHGHDSLAQPTAQESSNSGFWGNLFVGGNARETSGYSKPTSGRRQFPPNGKQETADTRPGSSLTQSSGRDMTQCPACQKAYRLRDTAWGNLIRCPACRTTFRAPERSPGGAERDEPEAAKLGTLVSDAGRHDSLPNQAGVNVGKTVGVERGRAARASKNEKRGGRRVQTASTASTKPRTVLLRIGLPIVVTSVVVIGLVTWVDSVTTSLQNLASAPTPPNSVAEQMPSGLLPLEVSSPSNPDSCVVKVEPKEHRVLAGTAAVLDIVVEQSGNDVLVSTFANVPRGIQISPVKWQISGSSRQPVRLQTSNSLPEGVYLLEVQSKRAGQSLPVELVHLHVYKPGLAITAPSLLKVQRGRVLEVALTVERRNHSEPVHLAVEGPAGIVAEFSPVAADGRAGLRLNVSPIVQLGTGEIRVRATCAKIALTDVKVIPFELSEYFGELQQFAATSPVSSVAFSPRGDRILAGCADGTVLLLEGPDLRRMWSRRDHSRRVRSVTFSPDGLFALSGGDDATVIVRAASNGRLEKRFSGHESDVYAIAIDSNGQLVSASVDGAIFQWDRITGKGNRISVLHPSLSADLRSRDPKKPLLAFSGLETKTLQMWRLVANKRNQFDTSPGKVFDGHSAPIHGWALASDGSRLLTASDDGTIRLWNAESGAELYHFDLGSPVLGVTLSPDGKLAISGSLDKTIRTWQLP